MLMWKLPEIIASYYITVAAYLMCFLMLGGTERTVALIAVAVLADPCLQVIIGFQQLHDMISLRCPGFS